jgi:DNA-binding response OmpR family regulator
MAHILIVDDERSICELLEITFRKEGHRVEVARSGEAARRLCSPKFSTSSFRTFACRMGVASIC